jgi:hypothetical protein
MQGVPYGRVYKAKGEPHHFHPIAPLHSGDITCKHTIHTKQPQEVGYYVPQSNTNLQKIARLALPRAHGTNH